MDGFLIGFEAIPLRKRIRAALKSLEGLKGIGFGPSLKPKSAGCFKSRISLKPKTPGRFKPSRKLQVLTPMASLQVGSPKVSTEWISSLPLELAMVPCDDPPVFVVQQGVPVITNVEPCFGVSFGAADVGFGSSLEVRQISPVCFPVPPVVASLSQAEAYASARPLCKLREDYFPAMMDPVLSLASMEACAVRNPSPAMGLIRRGFFGLRVVYPSLSVEEASLSTQGCKDS